MSQTDFKMTVMGVFNRPVLRQSQEGCSISGAIDDRNRGQKIVLLNSKNEFHQPVQIKPTFSQVLE